MPWNRWYGLKSYIKSTLWIIPIFTLIVFMVVKILAELGSLSRRGETPLVRGTLGSVGAKAERLSYPTRCLASTLPHRPIF